MNKISRTRVRDSVDMTVFGFSHVGLFDVDNKCVLIISSVASAIGLFADVWFIPTYSGADVLKFHDTHGLSLILFASPDYKVAYLHIRVGRRGSLGRAGARYWTAITGWSVGVVTWMLFSAPDEYEHWALTPSVPESLSVFTRKNLPRILGVMLAISHPPLSRDYVLGNGGKVVFVPLTPLSFDRDGSSHGQSAGALRYHVTHTQSRARPCPSLETKNWSEGNLALASPESRSSRRSSSFYSSRSSSLASHVLGCQPVHLVTCPTHVPLPPSDTRTPPLACLLQIADRESATPRRRHLSQHSARARGMGAHAHRSGTLGPHSSRVSSPSPGFAGGPIFSWHSYMYQARQRLYPNATPPGSTLTQVDMPEDVRTHRVLAYSQ
ncbi:hypothetical protein EDB86DRAFT_3101577 [Lactarius hatsudake]|nr:hypothetical protein EDB86DRAFT_3101577 [Lactarius hatsudake]